MSWVVFGRVGGYELYMIDDPYSYNCAKAKMAKLGISGLPIFTGNHYDSPDAYDTGEWLLADGIEAEEEL